MIAGQIQTPGVFLEAEEILLRQVTAFTLDTHVFMTSGAGDYGIVKDVLKTRAANKATGFPFDWLETVSNRGNELVAAFFSRLPQNIRNRADMKTRIGNFVTGADHTSMKHRIFTVFDNAAEEKNRLLDKRKEATAELKRLRQRRTEFTDDEFRKCEKEFPMISRK